MTMSYLHSTMYLFQLIKVLSTQFINRFTFHYVSISTYVELRKLLSKIRFTFHYVSISTFHSMYLFCYRSYLHSTMYLFQQETGLTYEDPSRLFTFHYVSISTTGRSKEEVSQYNLHSTMYLFQRNHYRNRRRRNIIYIPLCIYFNSGRQLSKISRIIIYIPLCIYFNQISSYICYIAIIIYIPLCIYFNQMPPYMPGTVITIYIPLCIYFNRHNDL